jgi:hypothetical protein
MGVVVFKGEGEGDDVKLRKRTLRFDAEQRKTFGFFEQVARLGVKCPFSQALRMVVDQPVNRLKTKVRHADAIPVRVRETYLQGSSPEPCCSAFLGGQKLKAFLSLFPGHPLPFD